MVFLSSELNGRPENLVYILLSLGLSYLRNFIVGLVFVWVWMVADGFGRRQRDISCRPIVREAAVC